MAKLKHPDTLAKAVRDFLADRIIQGELKPGEALSEVPLSKELDVSRGTMREALRALHDLGLVEIRPHRGAAVAELTPEKANEILTLRAKLESWAARLAVERGNVTPEKVAAMRAALEEVGQASETGDRVARLERDMRFHQLMSSCSGHQLLIEQLESLRLQTVRVTYYARLFEAFPNPVSSHQSLLDALTSGDPEAAEEAVRHHIESSGRVLLEAMQHLDQATTDSAD